MTLTAVILTRDEERHIVRCLTSLAGVADRVLVVDSGSTDRTVEMARNMGVEVRENPWINYATQMNWGIDHVPEGTDWILRLDADEVITPELAQEIAAKLPGLQSEVDGVYVPRRMTFLGRPIRWGGLFPVRVLRLFRAGRGRCENRWMDEHILVDGATTEFTGEIVDDNHNSLNWWTHKHNTYASREVVDLLNLEYGFMPHETVADLKGGQQAAVKRWVKEKVYARLPGGLRAFLYFLYRYVFRLGFLDGKEGTAFHVLQGFWYRYLVDMKLHEVKTYMRRHEIDAVSAIRDVLGIDVKKTLSNDR
ncbi:Glycosyl transferase family 2 [Marinovum algicola]|uniref:Glycosyltransferase involved in cell wall bisynthesis n=1 Tax=Marinovum algicola TaxID=42444 RepID=A0A975ZR47_9RHOB|nr:glycosyltransferase family 2 protein [Marinovum algicola]SEK11272.1 Glycosyltransferase involved in cell wall bisynthesis [Marinovum algicola]SLN76451.1 Glycosyl transferase family 2 [Marinovum algicola]